MMTSTRSSRAPCSAASSTPGTSSMRSRSSRAGSRQRALGHVAGQRDDQHREFGEVDLVDGRLVGALRQVALGVGDLGADVLQRASRGRRRR